MEGRYFLATKGALINKFFYSFIKILKIIKIIPNHSSDKGKVETWRAMSFLKYKYLVINIL
jgi:hypothetical protein